MIQQQIALLESLLARTKDRKVDWRRTADDHSFQAVIGEFVIAVSRNREAMPDSFELTILDAMGSEVETVSTWRYEAGLADSDEAAKRGTGLLAELYEMARRQAHGAERAIDAILQELNS